MSKHTDILDWEASVDKLLNDQSSTDQAESTNIDNTTTDQCPLVAPLADTP